MRAMILSAGSALALAACSISPNLGSSPYLCAAEEPRCPDNYTCMEEGTRAVCVETGGTTPDAQDAAPSFQCSDDGILEMPVRNDTIDKAYQTDVGSGVQARQFGPISICPEGDRDNFQINLTTANKGIEVITSWESGTQISCAILNEAGTVIAGCVPMGQTARRACAPNLTTAGSPRGVFYAVAFSPGNLKNNYRVSLKQVDNCQ